MTTTAARFVNVRRYKRGATWDDGTPRLCVRCGVEQRRRNRATVTAVLVHNGGRRVPLGYCPQHTPNELRTEETQ